MWRGKWIKINNNWGVKETRNTRYTKCKQVQQDLRVNNTKVNTLRLGLKIERRKWIYEKTKISKWTL